jgi:ketosteroid isomerase-like protein
MSVRCPGLEGRWDAAATVDFFREVRRLVEPLRLEIHDILTKDSRAVVLGELTSRVKSAGKTVETAFAFALTISGGEITRFRMLEDNFAVSRAPAPDRSARPTGTSKYVLRICFL